MSRHPDPDKTAVYACERRLQEAANVGTLTAMGRRWTLEPISRFSTVNTAQLFATLACMENGWPPVTVRQRHGERECHYELDTATIALTTWGAESFTLCHELAHHAVRQMPNGVVGGQHGPTFRQVLCDLLASTGFPQQAGFLRAVFADAGLPVPRAA